MERLDPDPVTTCHIGEHRPSVVRLSIELMWLASIL